MGYKKEALKGISWTWLLRLVIRGSSFLKVAVIARVLTPAQFGLYGIAALVLSFLEVFTETGINILIIQENRELKEILNTAWIVSILRGLLIFVIILLLAPFISSFFKTTESLRLIYLISFVPLIRGFINPAIIKFQKELAFNKEFYFRGSLVLIESLFGILFVVVFKDPAGIIYGLLIGATVELIFSLLLIKPRPSFNYDREIFANILSRGKWLTAGGIFNYLYHNADNVVVGRVLGTSSLGLYTMSYNISMLPITELGNVVSKVVLPVYVKIAGDRERLKKAFLKTSVSVFLIVFPIGILFYIFAEQIVRLVLGPQWSAAVPIFKILAFFAIIRTSVDPVYSLFLALKKQEYVTAMTFVGFTCMILSIFPLINTYGIVGAGYAVIFGSLAVIPVGIYFLNKVLKNHERTN